MWALLIIYLSSAGLLMATDPHGVSISSACHVSPLTQGGHFVLPSSDVDSVSLDLSEADDLSSQQESDLCTICLRVPAEKVAKRRLKSCNHVFCREPCLSNWLSRSSQCPNCRTLITVRCLLHSLFKLSSKEFSLAFLHESKMNF